jgi:tetratricopeptide (TPR) repeat protein
MGFFSDSRVCPSRCGASVGQSKIRAPRARNRAFTPCGAPLKRRPPAETSASLAPSQGYHWSVRTGLLVLTLAITGCAARSSGGGRDPHSPATIQVPRVVVTPSRTLTLDEMFAEAERDAAAGRLEPAARGFDRVAALEPTGRLAAEALFRAGDIRDTQGQHEAALERYRRVADRHAGSPRARPAALRSVRLLLYLGDFSWAGRYADRLLAESALRPFEAVVAHSGKALSLVAEGDDVRASAFVERGRDVVEREGLDLAGRLPVDLAPLYFALGEVQRLRAERIRFVPLPPSFALALEQRCQLILDAQRAYSDTWRAYDAHWSTLAGFRLAEMYETLHRELTSIPTPASADTAIRRDLFEGAMRYRYSVLLEKARTMLEHTVAMAEREKERSQWVDRAKQSLLNIRAAELSEQRALDKLPYSRADLDEVFKAIRNKAQAAAQAQTKLPKPAVK